MTSGLVRVARVLRAPARRLSSGARPSYVHPLSEEVLSELRALRPAWFEEDAIEHDASSGTFTLAFTLGDAPPAGAAPGSARAAGGVIRTFYDRGARQHCLSVECGALLGRVVLSDLSKSAWQANVGDDRARVASSVAEMVRRIALAGRGEFVDDDAQPPAARAPPRAPQFPFPDQVPPPQG